MQTLSLQTLSLGLCLALLLITACDSSPAEEEPIIPDARLNDETSLKIESRDAQESTYTLGYESETTRSFAEQTATVSIRDYYAGGTEVERRRQDRTLNERGFIEESNTFVLEPDGSETRAQTFRTTEWTNQNAPRVTVTSRIRDGEEVSRVRRTIDYGNTSGRDLRASSWIQEGWNGSEFVRERRYRNAEYAGPVLIRVDVDEWNAETNAWELRSTTRPIERQNGRVTVVEERTESGSFLETAEITYNDAGLPSQVVYVDRDPSTREPDAFTRYTYGYDTSAE